MTPAQRTANARVAADVSWAKTKNRAARTASARAAADDRFYKLVDPDGVMTPADREKAVENARRAYFRQIALKRWKNRPAAAAS